MGWLSLLEKASRMASNGPQKFKSFFQTDASHGKTKRACDQISAWTTDHPRRAIIVIDPELLFHGNPVPGFLPRRGKDLSSSSSRIALTMLETSRMVGGGAEPGDSSTHRMATCSSRTMRCSEEPSLLAASSARSNTSAVHSSRITEVTHRASSEPSPRADAAFPVSSSSSSTPNARTSPRSAASPLAAGAGAVTPYSLMHGSMPAVKRTLVALRLPWAMGPSPAAAASSPDEEVLELAPSPRRAVCKNAMPSATLAAMCRRAGQSTGPWLLSMEPAD
ncbi:uncharacterized protein LOC112881064 [Panicum hallii]|uniref:uncharacterized protein LOC112881064 n=1 Tax=Panicum hallii TaxID=206008 RepID=UPI000DF4E335|nr:uncharacterized protein LOC112881064 [Panicum hallii]